VECAEEAPVASLLAGHDGWLRCALCHRARIGLEGSGRNRLLLALGVLFALGYALFELMPPQ
jgi:hypothetical protein